MPRYAIGERLGQRMGAARIREGRSASGTHVLVLLLLAAATGAGAEEPACRPSPSELRWARLKEQPLPLRPPDPRAGAFTVDSFSVVGFDVPTSTLLGYDDDGVLVDALPVVDSIGIQPVVGVEIIAGDVGVLLLGVDGELAEVDLVTGALDLWWIAPGSGYEALGGTYWGEIDLGNYSSNSVLVYDYSGNLLRTVPLSTNVGLMGIDGDSLGFFLVASGSTGLIHVYDFGTGVEAGTMDFGGAPMTLTGLGTDPGLLAIPPPQRCWTVMGVGSDELARIAGGSTTYYPSGYTWINGLDIGDGYVPVELLGFTVE